MCTNKPFLFSSTCKNLRGQQPLRAKIWSSKKVDFGWVKRSGGTETLVSGLKIIVENCIGHERVAFDHLCFRLPIITSAKEVMFLPDCLFVCLSVSQQDNSKSYGRIFLKFWGYVRNGTNYQWFNFGGDPEGILDSGSLWNFRYHCFQ